MVPIKWRLICLQNMEIEVNVLKEEGSSFQSIGPLTEMESFLEFVLACLRNRLFIVSDLVWYEWTEDKRVNIWSKHGGAVLFSTWYMNFNVWPKLIFWTDNLLVRLNTDTADLLSSWDWTLFVLDHW